MLAPDAVASKVCNRCGLTKPVEVFHRNPSNRTDGRQARCKACAHECAREVNARWRAKNRERARATANEWNALHPERRRERHLRTKFDIGTQDYDAMFSAQDGLCAICKRDAEQSYKGLHVDHDHGDGRVRGLLCHKCNMALGLLGDDLAILADAIAYLERSRRAASVRS